MKLFGNLIKTAILCAWFISCLVLMAFLAGHVGAAEPFELNEVHIHYRDFFPNGHDPLITQNGLPNRGLGKELNLRVNTDVLTYGYWNNLVHSMTDEDAATGANGQFRTVGWNFQLGLHATRWLDIEYEHYSQHLLDYDRRDQHFPVQDSIGIKLYLFRKHSPASIF